MMVVRRANCVAYLLVFCVFNLFPQLSSAQLNQNFYANICPNAEDIVRGVLQTKLQQGSFATVPATLRLFFHDCFVEGCDASIIIGSSGNNRAEKDHPDNLSLAGDGFDMVMKAKAAIDAVPSCRNRVSCADILAMAARDAIVAAGGPSYAVELGRLDGLSSTSSSVTGKLPKPTFNLDHLNAIFAANGFSQTEMITLSGAHTLGFSHCDDFSKRLYRFNRTTRADPSINRNYAHKLRVNSPRHADPSVVVDMDPTTPRTFDNVYFQNLQQGKGLFTSDQVLFTDTRSKGTVDTWASNPKAFNQAFVAAMTKLGRVGVKTGSQGNIRRDCAAFN